MSIITIILFFVYSYGLGFAATLFLKNSENFLERNLMRIGIGMGVFCILGIVLNLLRIPLNWWVFLVLSLIAPAYYLAKNHSKIKFGFKISKSDIYTAVVLLLFFITIFMYAKGAFSYPYMEDDDSWAHAKSIKYVALEKTAFEPKDAEVDMFHYIDPYPPAYDIMLAMLHQTSSSLMWTMKFFNTLIISLGVIFFYFFAKLFINSRRKALFATFIFASIPCYLTHFIWSHSLAVTLFFPAMYCMEMIKVDKKWAYACAAVLAGIIVTQPTQAIKIFFMIGLYLVVRCAIERKILFWEWGAIITGGILSLFWWFNKIGGIAGGEAARAVSAGGDIVKKSLLSKLIGAFDPTGGSASRAYTFNDFFVAKHQGMINVNPGIGIIVCILAVIGIVFVLIKLKSLIREKKSWSIVCLLWIVFAFLGVNSMTFNLPIGLFAFRFWVLLAIPAAFLAAEGSWFLSALGKKINMGKVVLAVLIFGIILTSAHQKYSLNTSIWPPGGLWGSMGEIQGYSWLKDNLPVNEMVLPLCGQGDKKVIGFDKIVYSWRGDGAAEFKQIDERLSMGAAEISSWMRSKNYDYAVIDSSCVGEDAGFGVNETNDKVNELAGSGLFIVEHQEEGFLLFKRV